MSDVLVPGAGGSLAVRDLGGAGPDVLLLHGAGANLEHWVLVTPLLRDRCRLVLVDLPAHGESSVPERYSFDEDVAAVDTVRRALRLHGPTVVGHSYGGILAVALGARHPDGYRLVVNVDGIGFGHADTPHELWGFWGQHDDEAPPESGDDDWLEREVSLEKEWLREVGVTADLPEELVRRGYRRAVDGLWHRSPPLSHHLPLLRSVRRLDLLSTYDATRCRTVTVVARRRDAPTPEVAAAMTAHVDSIKATLAALSQSSTARVVLEVPGGHAVPLEHPDLLAQIVADTVSRGS